MKVKFCAWLQVSGASLQCLCKWLNQDQKFPTLGCRLRRGGSGDTGQSQDTGDFKFHRKDPDVAF